MKICHYILIMVMSVMAIGCSSASGDEPVDTSRQVCELVISLSTNSSVGEVNGTRADDQPWGDPYPEEEGTTSENEIRSVSLYLVTEDGEDIYTLNPTSGEGGAGFYYYRTVVNLNDTQIVGRTDDGRYFLKGRLVAIANYPSRNFIADPFAVAPYSVSTLRYVGAIPMWGAETCDGVTLEPGSSVSLGNIKLLRSIPKISIELDDDFKDEYIITRVVADQTGYGDLAHVEPRGAKTASDTDRLMMEDCFNPEPDTENVAPYFYDLNTSAVYSYVAERECQLYDGKPMSLSVTVQRRDGSEPPFTGKVYLCDYRMGAPIFSSAFTALVRNHDYKYRLSLTPLEFLVSVDVWKDGGKYHLELE